MLLLELEFVLAAFDAGDVIRLDVCPSLSVNMDLTAFWTALRISSSKLCCPLVIIQLFLYLRNRMEAGYFIRCRKCVDETASVWCLARVATLQGMLGAQYRIKWDQILPKEAKLLIFRSPPPPGRLAKLAKIMESEFCSLLGKSRLSQSRINTRHLPYQLIIEMLYFDIQMSIKQNHGAKIFARQTSAKAVCTLCIAIG